MLPLALALVILGCLLPATGSAASLSATPTTFRDVFYDAQPGDTIVLADGSYGTFWGALKPGEVTIKAQEGAVASMRLAFSAASNLTLDGLRIWHADISGWQTKDITVRNSDFEGGSAVLDGGSLVDANVLLEGNRFTDRNVCAGCYAGRVQIANSTQRASGITIRNNLFAGGNADGIQNGGNGVKIIGNEFRGLAQGDNSVAHTDAVQLYGSKNTLIQGNYFDRVSVAIGAYDGADHETIEDNVVVGDGTSAYVMQLLSDKGSVVRHNTFAGDTTCAYGVRCGTILLGNKSIHPRSTGTVLSDNILTSIAIEGAVPLYAEKNHNLHRISGTSGAPDLQGTPSYVGGEGYRGYVLAAGSPGKGSASDGLDVGARIAEPAPPPPGDYAPVCTPLCDETITALQGRLSRIREIANRDAYSATQAELRQWLLDIRTLTG